jgi:hypothetical protein
VTGHIFVTYSGTDVADPYVRAVVGSLTAAGLSVHAQQESGTDKLTAATRKLIDTCGALVPIILPATAGSRRVRGEVTYAQDQGRPVLALWVDGEVPEWLEFADVDSVVGRRPPSPDFVERLRQLALEAAGPPGVPMDLIRRGRHNARRDEPPTPEQDAEEWIPPASDLPARRPEAPHWGEFTEPATRPGRPTDHAPDPDRPRDHGDAPRRPPAPSVDRSKDDDLRQRPANGPDRYRDHDDELRGRQAPGPDRHRDHDDELRGRQAPGPDRYRDHDDELRGRQAPGPDRYRDDDDLPRRPEPDEPARPARDVRRPSQDPFWGPDAQPRRPGPPGGHPGAGRPPAPPAGPARESAGRNRVLFVLLAVLGLIALAATSAAIVYFIARS